MRNKSSLCLGSKKLTIALALLGLCAGSSQAQTEKFRILVLNVPGGWSHYTAIKELKTRLNSLAAAMQFGIKHVDTLTESQIVPDTLNRYQVILLNNTTSLGAVIHTPEKRTVFQDWLKRGNGIVAIHEVMDHADLWPWMTDSVFGGTRLSQWSTWNSLSGRNAKVKWDDLPTDGVVRSNAPEYAYLKAGIPGSETGAWFTYPDSWSSFTVNPRGKVDVLMRIDESTYDVPQKMGEDHPIAWAKHIPNSEAGGRPGRFIFTNRGHEAAAFSGQEGITAGSAPNDVWGQDVSPTYNFIRWSICWAAAASGKVDEACRVPGVSIPDARAPFPRIRISVREGRLDIQTGDSRNADIQVFNLAGQCIAQASGRDGAFFFSRLKKGSLALVKVRIANGPASTFKVLLQE